jgi:hypothetical protein
MSNKNKIAKLKTNSFLFNLSPPYRLIYTMINLLQGYAPVVQDKCIRKALFRVFKTAAMDGRTIHRFPITFRIYDAHEPYRRCPELRNAFLGEDEPTRLANGCVADSTSLHLKLRRSDILHYFTATKPPTRGAA